MKSIPVKRGEMQKGPLPSTMRPLGGIKVIFNGSGQRQPISARDVRRHPIGCAMWTGSSLSHRNLGFSGRLEVQRRIAPRVQMPVVVTFSKINWTPHWAFFVAMKLSFFICPLKQPLSAISKSHQFIESITIPSDLHFLGPDE